MENNHLEIYDGSNKKLICAGNAMSSNINQNQIFISYTNNGNWAPGKGFSASFAFGKKLTNYNFCSY